MAQEAFRFFFVLGGRHDGDREAEDVLRILVRCFRKDRVLFEADGDVAHFVDGGSLDAAEVLHARQNDVDELVEERFPVRSAERHLIADDIARAHLEVGDGFLGAAYRGSLPRDAREPVHDKLKPLFILDRAYAARDDDLHHPRRLHRTCVAEVALERVECIRLYCCCFHRDQFDTYLSSWPLPTATR